MTLVQIREQFAKLSGRYDLIVDTTDWADNGADFFIQAGQDYLDRLRYNPKADNTIFEELAAGAWYLTFEKCRSIKDVWINNTEGRSKLVKKDLFWLYEEFSALVSETDRGTPLYYCPARLRSTEKTDQISLGTFFNYVKADSDDQRGILILGPPDESIVVEIHGLFYSDALTADGSESYWSQNWPIVLVMASMRALEVIFRGSKSMTSWDNAIAKELEGLDKDSVDEEVDTLNQIEG